jgi:hypothetical protein
MCYIQKYLHNRLNVWARIYYTGTYLGSIKHIHNINMKISLKPKNIIVSSMEDLQHKDTEKCVYLGCPTAYLKGKKIICCHQYVLWLIPLMHIPKVNSATFQWHVNRVHGIIFACTLTELKVCSQHRKWK